MPTPAPTVTQEPAIVPASPIVVVLNWAPKECLTNDPLIVYGKRGKSRELDVAELIERASARGEVDVPCVMLKGVAFWSTIWEAW